ncbi:prepilin-type N-terminal cleavage/methylation domain-containing protein [Euhalothece natronophila Z-M001]|uniref:Prepilin-type N-terminal cleavage/methylation domain-containing protein n=1 Tax=Euhalothece natronophila Z-M001 TaxID=522448 RepID=A0A5B8NHX5_9CHRO|nr:prepilin-type N-terminal cleavage/methylation domain-containing protein [Euhalothece natronophila]QDZ38496.1 prepilin-type N-terminal cleavage/methylation domain-containing protein [Euhalothece natronophila Z-M001]
MKPFILQFFQNLPFKKKESSRGFTLLEVLIATVMSSIVISSLLYFMIDIIRSNAAETAQKNTLQEMRLALEFMTDDLKEAVYVYTGDDFNNRNIEDVSNDGLLNSIDTSDDLEPILVFWKLEDVPYDSDDNLPNCEPLDDDQENECQELRISQRTYTLVAYVQDNNPTDTWDGESVIYRYQLRKYDDVSTLSRKDEYVDPVQDSSFANWPYNSDSQLPSNFSNPTINRNSEALVDFVDVPNNNNFSDDDVSCPDGYNRTPNNSSTSNSFYACVENTSGQKTVIVNLRGNPNGRVSFELDDNFTPLPTLNSSAILRGGR